MLKRWLQPELLWTLNATALLGSETALYPQVVSTLSPVSG